MHSDLKIHIYKGSLAPKYFSYKTWCNVHFKEISMHLLRCVQNYEMGVCASLGACAQNYEINVKSSLGVHVQNRTQNVGANNSPSYMYIYIYIYKWVSD
jgi:hypothetical protein